MTEHESDELSELDPNAVDETAVGQTAVGQTAVGQTAVAADEEDKDERSAFPAWAKVALIFALLSGGVLVLLFGSDAGDAFVYSKLVPEVMGAPESFEGKQLRVEGKLTPGTVKFREEPCEWRFQIEQEGATMPVRFPQCVVPDTFRDDYGISVTVLGRLGSDHIFEASEVVPRCPSKYEEQLKSGKNMPKNMPHSAPGPSI